MNGVGILDILVVFAYFAAIIYIGRRAKATSAKGEESYFLAGRKLGKLYQIFLNFGNATEPHGAVSNASFVYRSGASNAWYIFQTIFINPYFWFMNVWFRRVRLMTMADLFSDRFNSRWLGAFYSMFQICVAVLLIGFGSFTAYTITAALITKSETSWTTEERAGVEGFHELQTLESQRIATAAAPGKAAALTHAQEQRLSDLRDLKARGDLYSNVSMLRPTAFKWAFYLAFIGIVGLYIVLGGMQAAAVAEALQGTLIIAFSAVLIPTGLYAIGGWSQLSRLPSKMFNLFGGSITGWGIVAITLVTIIQMNALSANMNILGSAKDETAARMGVIGLYGKRFMIMLWTFAGLIAAVIFTGASTLADPDTTWGMLSEKLLGPIPGLIGLMLAGVIAAVMSSLAAKSMAVSGLFVRNLFRLVRPHANEQTAVYVARWAIMILLIVGLIAAMFIRDMMTGVKLTLTVNVPFGVLIMVMFLWRRVTLPAAWTSILVSIALTVAFPLVASWIPAMTQSPALTQTALDSDGTPKPVYWEAVTRIDKNDPNSALEGHGRFEMETFMMSKLGIIDAAKLDSRSRENLRYYVDAIIPFLLLVIVSLLTRNKHAGTVAFFYGKMKTPIGATPELDVKAVEETRLNPHRFDHTKLFGAKSSWEFTKWNKMDTWGFIGCCAISGGIIFLFWGLLKWASGV